LLQYTLIRATTMVPKICNATVKTMLTYLVCLHFCPSYYNFRVRKGDSMPPPNQLIGSCSLQAHGVCTNRAHFHLNLAQLGKTNGTSSIERELLTIHSYKNITKMAKQKRGPFPYKVDNPVFVYDVHQLGDANQTRQLQFQQDLQSFLGLTHPFPDSANATDPPNVGTPAMNICDNEFQPLRIVLLDASKRASLWIRHYFLQSPQVFVSNRDHFEENLEEWMYDPCVAR
jgi:hypothetical protein